MEIRAALLSDAVVLDELLTLLIHHEKQWDQNIDENFTVTDNYINTIGQDGYLSFVAEENGDVIGYVYGFIYQPPMFMKPVALLDALYVREGYRGKGYATALVNAFQTEAVREGVSAIELKVMSENLQALKLYSHIKFRETKKYMRLQE